MHNSGWIIIMAVSLAAITYARAAWRDLVTNPPRLTPKGERWLTRCYTTAVILGCIAIAVLVLGFVGAIETGGMS